MNIVVEVKATELADAINNLAVALGDMMAARNEMKADAAADKVVAKAKKKAQSEVAENTDSTGSGPSSANVSATVAEVTPPLPTAAAPAAPQSEAGAPLPAPAPPPATVTVDDFAKDREQVVILGKKLGMPKVKEVIAEFGVAKFEQATPDVRQSILGKLNELAASL